MGKLWWFESRFLLKLSDGKLRMWSKWLESMDPWFKLVVVVHLFEPLSTARASFKCHSWPECCSRPCPSLHVLSVCVFWLLLLAEAQSTATRPQSSVEVGIMDVQPSKCAATVCDDVMSVWSKTSVECFTALLSVYCETLRQLWRQNGGPAQY